LHHLDSGRIIGENETTFMADGSSSTFRVSFKEPLEIQQGEYYVASAKLKVFFERKKKKISMNFCF
jgi:BTB/POZ domain-containing protein 1/2